MQYAPYCAEIYLLNQITEKSKLKVFFSKNFQDFSKLFVYIKKKDLWDLLI